MGSPSFVRDDENRESIILLFSSVELVWSFVRSRRAALLRSVVVDASCYFPPPIHPSPIDRRSLPVALPLRRERARAHPHRPRASSQLRRGRMRRRRRVLRERRRRRAVAQTQRRPRARPRRRQRRQPGERERRDGRPAERRELELERALLLDDAREPVRREKGPFYTSERRGGVERRQSELKGAEGGD